MTDEARVEALEKRVETLERRLANRTWYGFVALVLLALCVVGAYRGLETVDYKASAALTRGL